MSVVNESEIQYVFFKWKGMFKTDFLELLHRRKNIKYIKF